MVQRTPQACTCQEPNTGAMFVCMIASSPAARPRFEFIGGDPALDFVNTVDRTAAGPADERLGTYADLLHWAVESGAVRADVAARLRRRAAARPGEARGAHAAALRTREILYRLFAATIAGERPRGVLGPFNDLLGRTLNRLELVEGAPARWWWRGMDERLDSVLWPVVRSAAELLTSDEAARLRMCDGPDCGWLYVDRSRNGLRRWCQMRTCGTREKSRRRRVTAAS
jgi:predicted RNA-binding Zn ribbon-like protein